MRRADVPVVVSVMISFAKFVVDASTTAFATDSLWSAGAGIDFFMSRDSCL